MRRLILSLAITLSLTMHSYSISNIENDGKWYHVYDAGGEQYKLISLAEAGVLKGYSIALIVFQKGQFYYIYDSNLKRLGQVAVSASGEIVNVSQDTFTTKRGGRILIFSKNGTLVSRR